MGPKLQKLLNQPNIQHQQFSGSHFTVTDHGEELVPSLVGSGAWLLHRAALWPGWRKPSDTGPRTGLPGPFQHVSRQDKPREKQLCRCPCSDMVLNHFWGSPSHSSLQMVKRSDPWRLFSLYFLSSSHGRHSWCTRKGLPEAGEQLPWALRSPCGASSDVAESQRGRAPAARSMGPGRQSSGMRAPQSLPGCPFGTAAQWYSSGWSTAPGSPPGRAGSQEGKAWPQGVSGLGCEQGWRQRGQGG